MEKKFESSFGSKFKIDFQKEITHFLGIKFQCTKDTNGDVTVFMSQQADITSLITQNNLLDANSVRTPYRSGYPIDSIPHTHKSPHEQQKYNHTLQEHVGSLNWITSQTRPDIATVTNLLSQYNHNCSPGHIDSARYAIKYLKGTADRGIMFSSKHNQAIESYVKYPVEADKIVPLTDANWGPQDQSEPRPTDNPQYLDLFKSRSLAGYIIWLGGPLDWSAKRQSFTARSSCHAEIGAMDECTKTLLYIRNILDDLNLLLNFTDGPIPLYNDNQSAIKWSSHMTQKATRYIQIKENAVREEVQSGFISPIHIAGKQNLADLFTKELKDVSGFEAIRNILVVTEAEALTFATLCVEGGVEVSVPLS